MKINCGDIKLDPKKELEFFFEGFGVRIEVLYKDGSKEVFRNCTEFHHRYNGNSLGNYTEEARKLENVSYTEWIPVGKYSNTEGVILAPSKNCALNYRTAFESTIHKTGSTREVYKIEEISLYAESEKSLEF